MTDGTKMLWQQWLMFIAASIFYRLVVGDALGGDWRGTLDGIYWFGVAMLCVRYSVFPRVVK